MDKDAERMENYKSLSVPLQNLYASSESGALMFTIFQKFSIDESMYRDYAESIGDVILGIFKISDLPRLFQQKLKLSADDAQRLTSQLIDFLSPVVEREQAEAQAKKESLSNLAQTLSTPKTEVSEVEPKPIETDNVAPLRTMEKDMSRIHGYGAYNELKESGELQEGDDETIVSSAQENVLSSKENTERG